MSIRTSTPPINGQEAITPDGIGIVIPNPDVENVKWRTIRVRDLATGVTKGWDPKNVELLDPHRGDCRCSILEYPIEEIGRIVNKLKPEGDLQFEKKKIIEGRLIALEIVAKDMLLVIQELKNDCS